MASFESLPTEVAQKCVEFLAFGEVTEWPTEVKSVSRGLRKAARWALTRGRWRPIRFVSEHGLDTLKKLRGGLNSLDDHVLVIGAKPLVCRWLICSLHCPRPQNEQHQLELRLIETRILSA